MQCLRAFIWFLLHDISTSKALPHNGQLWIVLLFMYSTISSLVKFFLRWNICQLHVNSGGLIREENSRNSIPWFTAGWCECIEPSHKVLKQLLIDAEARKHWCTHCCWRPTLNYVFEQIKLCIFISCGCCGRFLNFILNLSLCYLPYSTVSSLY